MKQILRILFVLSGMLPVIQTQAQEIRGRILDRQSRRPLAFVNIVYKSSGKGTVSNIDGEFSIASFDEVEFLKFSYVGYQTRTLTRKEINPGRPMLVELVQKPYDIEEVRILPGVNPAHRIINLVLENRDRNNPEKMHSFSYTSYSKMYFTVKTDSMYAESPAGGNPAAKASEGAEEGDTNPGDSAGKGDLKEMEDFLRDNHLFLMEFVSHREFLYPDRNRETVTASRVSGFKDPSFTLLASQIQSFSFYDELIMIWDRKYLNPISRGSTRKYLFILEDTMYTENNDTLFMISFRPLRGKNFDGLRGILHINSNGYAIQDVIAEAAENSGFFRVRIQQKYDLIDGRQWFPVQLNTDVMISPGNAKVNGMPMTLVGIGKTYLSDIRLDPGLSRKDFSQVELEVEEDAHRKDEDYWNRYRENPITRKDSNTYHLIDSIGEEAHFDRALNVFETFASGYIPVGFLNLDYQSIVSWNRYEGFRLGAAAETNEKISRFLRIGGLFAYGTRDREFKYGGHLKLNLNRRQDAFLKLAYSKDVVETAGWNFIEKPPITSSEIFRSFLIAGKDDLEEKSAEVQFRALRYFKINLYLHQDLRTVTTDYRYRVSSPEGDRLLDRFHITETGLGLKYAFREKFLETPRGNRISLGTTYPVLYANLHMGLPILGGEFEYLKIEGKMSKTFISKSTGDTRITLVGGLADRNLPYPLLYSGEGSFGIFTIETENSFATMRMNEFVSDRFASLHFRQDLGKLLFSRGEFQPGIVLAASAGFGRMKFEGGHVNLDEKTLEKGYYETGILFNNLLRQWFLGYGLGVFYRFGPYTLLKTIDNFAFKFTVRFNL